MCLCITLSYVLGIRVSNSTFNALVMRYSDQEGRIYFDDFIMCSIRLKSMFGMYRKQHGLVRLCFRTKEFHIEPL